MKTSLDKPILVLDGGLGTTLEDIHGVKFSQDTPLWSSHLLISDPVTLQTVQKNFADAGADIILTPTYQASHAGFRKTKPSIVEDEIVKYLQSGVKISRDACGSDRLVALSLGAYGAILQPSQEYSGEYGDMDEEALVAFHRERILSFDLSDVDIIAFETLPRLDEVRAVKRTIDSSKPYWISCVFPNENRLPDGSTIDQVLAEMMTEPRPWAIGFNCTKLHKVTALVSEFEDAAGRLNIKLPRLVLYPDGTNGQWYDTTTQTWVGEEQSDGLWHEKLYNITREVESRAVWEGLVVGGCCKTTPQHISGLKQMLSGPSLTERDIVTPTT